MKLALTITLCFFFFYLSNNIDKIGKRRFKNAAITQCCIHYKQYGIILIIYQYRELVCARRKGLNTNCGHVGLAEYTEICLLVLLFILCSVKIRYSKNAQPSLQYRPMHGNRIISIKR